MNKQSWDIRDWSMSQIASHLRERYNAKVVTAEAWSFLEASSPVEETYEQQQQRLRREEEDRL